MGSETYHCGSGDAAPVFSVALAERALQGKRLGLSILSAALEQMRKMTGTARLSPVRVSLIRMCLNDLHPQAPLNEALDPDLDIPAYLCGRLMSLYESVLYARDKTSGTRFADRFYAYASTQPAASQTTLDNLCASALQKLILGNNRGTGIALQRAIGQLRRRLSAAGQTVQVQGLEDQGRFALGYYYQKAENVRQARGLE